MEISELKNQTILITGAAGSIGRELVLGLAEYQPKQLILVDISELGMHSLLQEMAIHFPQVKLNYYLESICDTAFISALFQKQHIDIVFHAAAYKHVSLMEENVCAAVKTNIKGAKLLIDTSCKHNIARFLFISTDKAVEPISVMGKTKKVVEEYLLFKQMETTKTQLSILRLCNVYDSSGSVVPVFKARIQQQLPLEIKGKEVRRAFIQKAVILELVLKLLKLKDSTGVYIPGQTNLLTVERVAEKLLKKYAHTSIENYPITYLALPEYEKQEELLYSSKEQIDASSEDVLAKVYSPKPKLNLERLKHCILAAEAFDVEKAQQFLDELTAYV